MSDKTPLGDRMKAYEKAEAGRRLMPLLPVCARIDGRTFSSFTRDMKRPYDPDLMALMIETTEALVEASDALVGYTQSDEISLLWHSDDPKRQIFFDGRVQKMASVLSALATVHFNAGLARRFPDHVDKRPVFDARVWAVPTREEAANVFLWRERDATKNSLSMAARAHYSHADLLGKRTPELHDLLHAVGVNWNDYPASFKRGTWVQRRVVRRRFTADELQALPPKHAARQDPDLVVERTVLSHIEMPPFGKVINRAAVLFEGANPATAEAAGVTPGSASPGTDPG